MGDIRHRWMDNIKLHLGEMGGMWAGFTYLQKG
jgi:hypothetical protein